MTCTRLGIALLTVAALPWPVPAQSTTPGTSIASTATPEANQPATPSKKERALSTGLSSALSAGIKYTPPPPPPSDDDVDLRDVDKPRNGIIRLPKYVVEGTRPPVFNDRNLYSKEMLRRLAYQKYVSSFSRNVLNRYRLPIIGQGVDTYATMMYEADERKANMAEIDDKIAMYRVSGDDAEAAKLKDDTQRTFMRRTEGISTPGSGN